MTTPPPWFTLLAAAVAIVTLGLAYRSVRRYAGVARDLRRSQKMFEGFHVISADAIITIDIEQRITLFNHGAEQLFGYTGAEVLGQPLEVLLPSRFRHKHAGHITAFGQGGDVARRMGDRRSIFGLRKDGREFPAEASISRLDVDGTRVFSVVLRDITERVLTEERQRFLARASATLSTSLETEATLIAASHCGVPYLADCAVLDLIEPSGEVRRSVSVHDDPHFTRVLRLLEGRAASAPSWPFPVADVLASGDLVVRRQLPAGWMQTPGADLPSELVSIGVHAFITAPLRARGRVFGALTLLATDPNRACSEDECAIAVSLAERVAAALDNAALYREAKRASQARDDLAGIVSHDLRNPLSAISMCARVLAERPPDDRAKQRELAGAILDSVALMQRLIQDLLDVATIESGHLRIALESADLGAVARRALSMVQEQAGERGVQVSSRIPSLEPMRIDAMRMEQVFANLLANAVKFTDRGGTVSLELVLEPNDVYVTITDSGIGIPPEAMPHIFDRFWHSRRSARTVGTGLGLAIAKGIVVAHGGQIDVTSTVGKGSTFSFRLPMESCAASAAAHSESHQEPLGPLAAALTGAGPTGKRHP